MYGIAKFDSLIVEVNKESGPGMTTFKHLEKGHTFMSADSFHAWVEKGMRRCNNVYDSNDFAAIINAKGSSVQMEADDLE